MRADDILNNTDPNELRNLLRRLRRTLDAGLRPPSSLIVNSLPTAFPPTQADLDASGSDCCDLFKPLDSDGAWSWFSDPRAVYYNNKTYFGGVTSAGSVFVNSYDHIKKQLGTPFVLHAALEVDDHDHPVFLIRDSDKRILVFYMKHVGNVMYLRISTNPEDVSAFGSEVNLASQIGAVDYTYATPIQLLAETNDPIYLISRDHITLGGTITRWFYSKSTDGGATWSAKVNLFTVPTRVAYMKAVRNGDDRIDFFVTDGHPLIDSNISTYHFYYQGGNYYKTDGTQITASLPFTSSDLTQVHDGSSSKSWIWDIAIGNDGNPVVVFTKYVSQTDHRYFYGRWNGSAWVTVEMTAGGTELYNPTYYSGGIILDHENPSIVYLSKQVNSQWEIYRYKTDDHGATWMSVAITSESTTKNIRPISVYGHNNSEIVMLWLQGTYTTYTNYVMSIQAMGAWEDLAPIDLTIHGANTDTPADGDEFGFWDIVDHILKKISWANIKALLKTYFDTLYSLSTHTHEIAAHVHGLARWTSGGGTTFDLPDIAEYLESVSLNGLEEDPTLYSLSSDRTQVVFDSATTATDIVMAHYVLAQV